ncbi:MAG: hypothetical protein KC912_04865 [Proteobacteria bacterium]|nr:hypothetical protein [Pseudomonadota bacterium]
MIGIPIGLIYHNAMEWMIHKHVLHGRGKKRESFWSFHFHEHHQACRRNDNHDDDYLHGFMQWDPRGKEVAALMGAAAIHAPLFPVAPFFVATCWYSQYKYYRDHKRSHVDIEWGREHMPWHYDHHMGVNQDSNWCVTHPWFDDLMGTREPYIGTEREQQDLEKKAARERRKAQQTAA